VKKSKSSTLLKPDRPTHGCPRNREVPSKQQTEHLLTVKEKSKEGPSITSGEALPPIEKNYCWSPFGKKERGLPSH